jgi:hypothetical protein
MKYFIILFLLISSNVTAQTEIISEAVVPVDSVKKELLYNRALHWIVLDHNNAKSEIKLQDSVGRDLIGVFSYNYKISVKGKPMADYCSASDRMIFVLATVDFNLQVFCRDGRYKYKIESVGITQRRDGDNYAKTDATKGIISNEIENRLTQDINVLIADLKTNMSKPTEVEAEW